MNKIKLKMSMFRQILEENLTDIYESDYATYLYVVLRYICKSNISITTTPKLLYQTLSEKQARTEDIKGIKEGLSILEKADIIFFEQQGNSYMIEPCGLDIDRSEKYFYVSIDYILKIMNEKSGIKLLHHYLLLCSTINVLNNTGTHSRDFFADSLDIDVKTITRHHQKFVEMGIICFSEHRNGINKNGEFVNLPKLYVMPEFSNKIEDMQKEKIHKSIKDSNKEINKKKREQKEKEKVIKMEEVQETSRPFSKNPFG